MAMTFTEIYLAPWFLAYVAVQFVCYGVLYRVFSRVHILDKNPLSVAHQVVAFPSLCYISLYASYTWFFDAGFQEAFEDDMIFSYYEAARNIVWVMMGFMIVEIAHLIIAKGGPEVFMHHIFVLVLGNIGLMYGGPDGTYLMLYYGVYFFGVSELSSIPLAFMDLFRENKDLANEYPVLKDSVRVVFSVLFVILRVFYWAYVVYGWLGEFFGKFDEIALWAFLPFAIACVLLTGLQWFWAYLIVRGVMKMAKGQRNDVEEAITERKGSISLVV